MESHKAQLLREYTIDKDGERLFWIELKAIEQAKTKAYTAGY